MFWIDSLFAENFVYKLLQFVELFTHAGSVLNLLTFLIFIWRLIDAFLGLYTVFEVMFLLYLVKSVNAFIKDLVLNLLYSIFIANYTLLFAFLI